MSFGDVFLFVSNEYFDHVCANVYWPSIFPIDCWNEAILSPRLLRASNNAFYSASTAFLDSLYETLQKNVFLHS